MTTKPHEAGCSLILDRHEDLFWSSNPAGCSTSSVTHSFPYTVSERHRVCYGICGWVEEWVNRGMPESEKEMMALLETMQKENR